MRAVRVRVRGTHGDAAGDSSARGAALTDRLHGDATLVTEHHLKKA